MTLVKNVSRLFKKLCILTKFPELVALGKKDLTDFLKTCLFVCLLGV